MTGQAVCRHHGGASPQARRAARGRALEGKVIRLAAQTGLRGVPADADAYSALDFCLRESWRLAEAARRLMRSTEKRLRTSSHDAAQQTALTEVMRSTGDFLDRLAKIAKASADAGVAEREVRIAEDQADQMADVLLRVLADPRVALAADQQRLIRRLVAAEVAEFA